MTPQAYNAGKVSTETRKAARGHAQTPERPQQAFRNPDKYGKYLRRSYAKNKPLPGNLIPEQLSDFAGVTSEPSLPSSIGHPQKFSFNMITFYRTAGGVANGNTNVMVHTHYSPNGDITERAFDYDESEFYELLRLAKDRGFTTTVESGQGDERIVA